MMEALELGCQSSEVFWAAMAEVWALRPYPAAEQQQSVTEQQSAAQGQPEPPSAASSDAEQPKKTKKAKKLPAPEGGAEAPKEQRPPSAWNLLVTQTVSEMKQRGWESWTTVEGVVWPGSKWAAVKDKKGAESEQFVYASGEHAGKQPSPALGGMLRASYLKAQSDPAAKAKAEAYYAKLAEKRSVSSASASPSDAEGEVAAKRKPAKKMADMTEEERAAAKAKRDAAKAKRAEASTVAPIEGLLGGWAEV